MPAAGPSEKSDRAFRTISEAAAIIGVPQHVLRFWETRFTQLQPLKRGGNRRYYRTDDMALLQTIRAMLHDEGLTIRGAQLALAGGRERATPGSAPPPLPPADLAAEPAVVPTPPTAVLTPVPRSLSPAPGGIDRARLIAIRDRLRYALVA